MSPRDALRDSGSSAAGATRGRSRDEIHRSTDGIAVAYLWQRRGAISARSRCGTSLLVGARARRRDARRVPLGLALERARRAAEPVSARSACSQTIPSIALLAFMIPLLGIGIVPALVALWLYALYPIARSTYTGVRDADPAAVEAAEALGMTPRAAAAAACAFRSPRR